MAGVKLYLLQENGSYRLGSGKLKEGLLQMEKAHYYLLGNPVYERRKERMAGTWQPHQNIEAVLKAANEKPELIRQVKGQLAAVYSDDSPIPVLCEDRSLSTVEIVDHQTSLLVDRARNAQVEATRRDNGAENMMGIGLLACAVMMVMVFGIVAASRVMGA